MEVSFMRDFGSRPAVQVSRSYGKQARMVQTRRLFGLFTIAFLGLFAAFATDSAAEQRTVRLVVLGDSLSAGLGLAIQDALPAKLEKALKARGLPVAIANAGVSGDTTAGGLARLDWSVPDGTDAVILELGANDALRALDPAQTRATLDAIITRLKARKIAVLLTGMLAPRNLGPDYAKAFDPIYPELAKAHDLVFYPFILEGVAANPALNQGDGMHPTAAGVDVMVQGLLPKAEELISRVKAGKG
jgi:acyl-CoA thioesterase-1